MKNNSVINDAAVNDTAVNGSKINLAKLSEVIIDECSRLEPCQTEVCADDSRETKVVFENTDYSVASHSHSTVFGVRTIANQRLGFITTNSIDEGDLKAKAREAQMVARLSPENPNHSLASPTSNSANSSGASKDSNYFALQDEKLVSLSPKELLKYADLFVNETLKDPCVTLDRIEMNLTTSTRTVYNSLGIARKMNQTVLGWFVMGMAKNGNEVTSLDYDADTAGDLGSIESKILRTAKDFTMSVKGGLGARGGKSYLGKVLLHPAAVHSLIGSVIGYNINGRAQQDGMSKWTKSINQKVASEKLTFVENPTDETRPSDWMPFDREGVLTKRHEVIKNGLLNFTAHNCFSAKREKISSTGNAMGSARSVPSIGLSGLSVESGDSTEHTLLSELKSGLVIKRFSGNADPVSGDFSGVAKNSWWVENGERAFPVKEVMVSGNMFDLLNHILLVGSEKIRQMGSFDSPYILVDGISVTSGTAP
jgi:PmbA protein